MSETLRVVSKARTNRVTGVRLHGPVHIERIQGLTWCGRRMGWAWYRSGTVEEVTCTSCVKAHTEGKPRPWRRL